MGTCYVDSMVRKEVVKKRGCSGLGRTRGQEDVGREKLGKVDMKLGNDL